LSQIGNQQSKAGEEESEWKYKWESSMEQTGYQEDAECHKLHGFVTVAKWNTTADVPAQAISC